MPFTPSHAVVALPFVRTPLVPAAVAVGAMAPDLPLFVRLTGPGYALTHDLRALPLTVIVALALLLVWRCVLRPAARELAPRPIAARLPPSWETGGAATARETLGVSGGAVSIRVLAVLLVSLSVGVASHIVWDLFTHEGRWGVEVLPVLDEQWGPLSGVTWLQHGSSAVGLTALGVCGVAWLVRQRPRPVPRAVPQIVRVAWWVSLPVVLALAWLAGLAAFGPFDAGFTPAHLAYRMLPPASALWGAATVALAIAVQLRAARSGDRG